MKPKIPLVQTLGLALITLGCLVLALGLVRQAHHHGSTGFMLAAVFIEMVGVVITGTQLGRRK